MRGSAAPGDERARKRSSTLSALALDADYEILEEIGRRDGDRLQGARA